MCIVAGAAVWCARPETAPVAKGAAPLSRSPSPRAVVPARIDPPRPERDDPRDVDRAAPVERLVGDVAAKRVRELVPEATWVGVQCRSSECTLEIDCSIESEVLCEQLANILVFVDGMRFQVRKEPVDVNERFRLLVDVELPSGDAETLRRAMERELELRPAFYRRMVEAIALTRRGDDPRVIEDWAERNLRTGIDLAMGRLAKQLRAAHSTDPSECAPTLQLAPTVVHVEASRETLTLAIHVRNDADLASSARACLEAYFAGSVQVGDDEVAGPFPETTRDLDIPMPMRLSAYLP
jgi:hypothetical protein